MPEHLPRTPDAFGAGIIIYPLENPFLARAPFGEIVAGTDEGVNYSDKNYDAVVVNCNNNAFAIVDGVGRHEDSLSATAIATQVYHQGLTRNASFKEMQRKVHQEIAAANLSRGVCYLAARLNQESIDVAHAGDVRLIIVRNGRVVNATKDHSDYYKPNVVTNAITAEFPGQFVQDTFKILPGDIIITASDGLWHNFSNDEVAAMTEGCTAKECFAKIAHALDQAMRDASGKKDNRSLVVYKIDNKLE